MDTDRHDGLTAGGFAALAVRRGVRLLGIALAVLCIVGIVVVGAVAGLLAMAFPRSGFARCVDVATSVPIEASGPAVATEEQRRNAAAIVDAGRNLKVPERGLWIALATALQESGLRNLTYGDRDSLGLFQQRPSQGWGTPTQVLNPAYAATQFFIRLMTVPEWTTMPLWRAAQSVQRSGFPLAYAKWDQYAADLLASVDYGNNTAAADRAPPCGQSGRSGGAPGSPIAGGGCVEDDPTSNGCITTTTRDALTQAEAAFRGLRKGPVIRSTGCFAARPTNPTSDHPLGKGCDFFPGLAGRFAWGIDLENGWRAAEWFRVNATDLQVSYVIWQGRIWTPGIPDQDGWGQPYTGGGVYDASDAVGGHYDHLHVSFRT